MTLLRLVNGIYMVKDQMGVGISQTQNPSWFCSTRSAENNAEPNGTHIYNS